MKSQVKFPELLTVEEVSEITRIPKSTLANWAADADRGGQAVGPPHIRFSPRKRLWAAEDVAAWVESKRRQ